MAVPNKLPRAYFRKRNPESIPAFKQTAPKTSTMTFGQAVARRSYWLSVGKYMADDARQVMKGTHLEATMDNWAFFKAHGRLTPEVAIIVDGSVNRPLKGVKVFGEIVIQEPAKLDTLYDAVLMAVDTIRRRAHPRAVNGYYLDNIYVLADNTANVPIEMFRSGRDKLNQIFANRPEPVFFSVINTMPYAAKEERNMLPGGIFYAAWKTVRSAYGDSLSVRFRYYTVDRIPEISALNSASGSRRNTRTTGTGPKSKSSDPWTKSRYEAGKLLSFPTINIGQPGAFNSGASRILIKANTAAGKK